MNTTNAQPRYFVSPCGKNTDFFSAGLEPAGWTDVTHLDDAAVSDLMVRRMWDVSKSNDV